MENKSDYQDNSQLAILTVDDTVPMLKLYKMTLGKNFNVHTAHSFKEVQSIENKHLIKLVVMDYHMADVEFPEILSYIIQNFPNATKRILITGRTDFHDIEKKYTNFFNIMYQKPIPSYDELNKNIYDLLRK